MKNEKNIQYLIIIAMLILVNVVASYYHGYIDLTEEKRYTLSPSTEKIVESMDDDIFIKVLLDGKFPAGFKRLQAATEDILEDFNDINPRIQYLFEDPIDGTPEDVSNYIKKLGKDGIHPTNLKYFDGKEYVQKPIFPYALISFAGRFSAVNLLQEQIPGESEEQTLNKSVELLEYKFANIFQKLQKDNKENVILLSGNDELPIEYTISLQQRLRQYYNVGRVNIDSVVVLDSLIDVLIVAGPKKPFTEQQKFKLDQYIMNGGKVIWLLDNYNVRLDSLSRNRFHIPEPFNLNLDDMLFKYGMRIKSNIIMDLESSSIPQVAGKQGDQAQVSMFKWYYHPLATAASMHPLVKNTGRVNVFAPSTIEKVKTTPDLTATPLLQSSQYSTYQMYPMRMSFEILKVPPRPEQYNKGPQTIAWLMEGSFPSLFANRITPSFQKGLDDLKIQYRSSSPETKQIFVSDSEFMKNAVNFKTKRAERIGFNTWDKQFYHGNEIFILNCIEYLVDNNGVLESRAKEIKLRPLDKVKTEKESFFWQFFNIGIPLIAIVLFGLGYNAIRRYRYARNTHTRKK